MRSSAMDIIPNMGITERRQAFADFTSPVETFPVSIFIRQAESGINGAQDLPGHKVAVVEVNVGYALLKDRTDISWSSPITRLKRSCFCFRARRTPGIPQPVIDQLARKSGIENKLKVVGKPLKEIVRGIAVQKGRDDLLGRLDAAVKRFVATEAYSRIYVRWYGAPEAYWTVGATIQCLWADTGGFCRGDVCSCVTSPSSDSAKRLKNAYRNARPSSRPASSSSGFCSKMLLWHRCP